MIHYDPHRLDIKYFFEMKNKEKLHLSKLLEDYVRKLIETERFSVTTPVESILILDGKKYSTNEYTDAYLFDPFFGSVAFELKKNV